MNSMLLLQNAQASFKSTVQKALIVIDSSVANVSALVADVTSEQADVLLLSAERDGIAQITEAIASYSHLSSLHIVSHATPGCLHLGSAQLSFESLDRYADSLSQWATLLKGKDILLYGCQVAKGAMGHLFVQQLRQLTGANIAASAERIGRVGKHTNWTLNTQLGQLQTPIIFSAELQASYAGHFDPVVDFSVSTDTLIESEGTPFSFIFELSEPPPEGGTVVRFEADQPQAINQWNLFALGFTGLAGQPVDVSPNLDFSAFEITIIEQRATIDLPVFNDFTDDSPDPYTWTASAVSGGTIGSSTASVTIYDDPSEVPTAPPAVPEVSISSDITTLVEDEGTEVTLTINLSEAPEGAVLVNIDAGKPFALGDFDIFAPPPQASSTGGQLVGGNQDNSAFTFAVLAQTATITLPIFDDPDRTEDGATSDPSGPLRNDDIGEEQTTFTITSGEGYTISPNNSSVTLTLKDSNAAPNTAPVADNDAYSTAFGTPLTVNANNGVLDGDVDADGDDLSVEIDADPSNGSVSLNANGAFTYTPDASFSGDDSFTYTVDDGNGGTDSATVTVTVEEEVIVNTAPVADDDAYSTAFDTPLTVNAGNGVLDGDTDADGDALTVAIDSDPGNGSVSLNANGAFTYTPDAGFTGDDSFTYTVDDGNGGTDTATVTVTVEEEVIVNTAPVADDDAYSTAFDTPLTVNAGNGVLDGDTDADGDALTVAIDSDPGNGSVSLNANGAFTYTPDAGFTGDDAFTYTVDDGNGGTDSATVTVTVNPDEVVTPQVSITTSTNFGGAENALVEDEGTELTVQFSLDNPAPTGGLRVFVDSEVEQIVNRLDLPTFFGNPQLDNIALSSFGTDFDNTGLVLTIDEGATSASFTIPVFDNAEPDTFLPETFDGKVDAVFSLKTADQVSAEDAGDVQNVSDYTIDPNAASSTVTFADTVSQITGVVGDPVVSFSVTPDTLSEAEGTELVLSFSVNGDIPPEGITVNLEGDTAEILQQFLAPDGDGAVQTRVTDEGTILYRFDTSFGPGAGLVGGTLDVFSLEDGDPAEDNSDPAAAGTGFLSNFSFTITEPTASITLPVSNDLVQEVDQTFSYTLAEGVGYEVDAAANSGTFTVTDGITSVPVPVVGVTATPETLVESEQTVFTVTFTTEGDIPAEGLVVQLQGPPRSIAEFDVNATNPRLPEDETVVEGVTVDGGSIVGTDEVAGSLFLRITDPTATITVPVFDDGPGEGIEDFTFNLIDGEDYEVDPAAGTFDVTIEDDAVVGDPVVSFSVTPDTVSEADGPALVLNFSVEGEIPEGGITVNLEGDTAEILQQFLAPDGDGAVQTRVTDEGTILYRFDTSFGPGAGLVGGTLDVFSLEDGDPAEDNSDPAAAGVGFLSNFSFTITEPTASITLPVSDDLVQEVDQTFSYTLVGGEGYEVDAAANSGTFTVTDGITPATSPVVGVTATPTTLVESEQTVFEITFTTEGDIPAEGLVVQLQGPPRSIAEFDVNATNPRLPEDETVVEGVTVDGGSIVGTDEVAGSLFLRITDPTATITVPVFDNGPGEGTENFSFNLVDGEAYEVDAAAGSFDVTIEDDVIVGGDPVVSFSTSTDSLNEAEGTPITFNFTVDGQIPADGLVVRTADNFFPNPQLDFNLLDFSDPNVIDGIEFFGFEETGPGQFVIDWKITKPEAFIKVAVFDDNIAEADTSFTTGLLSGDGYTLDPDASTATVSVTDGVDGTGGPAVSITADKTAVNEGDSLTITFNVDGDIPDGGLEVVVDSDTAGALGDFITTDDTGNPLLTFTGLSAAPAPNGDASGFIVNITESTATIGLDIFDDGPGEGPEIFDFQILDGENYDVDAQAGGFAVTLNDEPVSDPVVSFSVTPDTLSEAGDAALVLNFSVDGDIPPEGITVNLEGDTAEILQQFLAPDGDGAVQTRVTDEGTILYRFDTSFGPGAGLVGGTLDVFSLEDGDPAEDNSDPAAAGTGFLSNFSFTITEPTASITLPVSNDLVQEVDQTFSYTLAEGVGYEVDAAANSGTFTVTDGITSVPVPVVGVTATPETLVESEQTVFTVTFTTEGDIPAEGLVVQLQGPPRSIAEFDVNATNPRLPEDETVVEGVTVDGGSIVGTDEVAGSLFLRITDPTATITVPVFDDGPGEGIEDFTFNLIDGEDYEVDPAAGTFDVTIEDDAVVGDPVVSFSVTPDTVSEADGPALVLNFSVEGEIPEGGITVNLEGDTAEILQQFLAPDGDGAVQTRVTDEGTILYRFDTSFGPGAGLVGGTLDVFSLEDGDPAEDNSDPAAAGVGFLSNFSFTITEPTASITLPVSDDLVQEVDQTFSYTLVGGEGYEVDAAANSGTFTVTDGITPATSPVVGVTATPTTLVESEQTVFEITFTTEGDIPAEGLVVQLQGPPRSIAEFDVNATNPRLPEDETVVEGVTVDGGSIVGTDEVAGSLFLRITDPTATITVPVFDNGPGEGTENFSFNLVDGEAYEVDAAAGSFDVTIEDNVDTPPGEIIDGTAGEDRLFGTGADDIITLLGGDDTAFGGAGNDTINGGEGDDRLAGNAGNDILSGDSGNDRAFASSGTDIVDGGSGDDRLFGGADRDILIGGSGDDFLNGGAGDDVLMGVTGRDILIGGGGADLFVFGTGDGGARVGNNLGNDLIRDFEVGVDKIGLVEGELTFADITITQSGNRTLLGVASSGETLAVLKGVDASSIGESTFEIVPNVATVDDAMTIL